MRTKYYPQASRNRRATAMGVALVVLLVVGMVSSLTLQAILRSHRQVREEEQRVQAELLADSAASRAAAMLQLDPAWSGEIWRVALADPAEAATTGIATIRVEKSAESDDRRIFITAVYPDDPVHRAEAVRELTSIISQPGENK